MHRMMQGGHERQMHWNEARMQPSIDVHDIGPNRRFRDRNSPRQELCLLRQPGNFGPNATRPQPLTQMHREHVCAGIGANRRKPDGRLTIHSLHFSSR